MEKRSKNILIAILAVVLTAAVVWGIVENVQQRTYRLRLQNMLERSFFELVGGLDDVEVKLNKLTISDSAKQDVLLLSELYRQADSASRELAALPGGQESMEEVLAFVNRLSEYSGVLMRKVAQGESLTAENEMQLQILLERCKTLNQAVQSLDVQEVTRVTLLGAKEAPEEGDDPYAAFANPSTPMPTLLYDGAFSQAARTAPKALGTERIDEDSALVIAQQYVGEKRVKRVEMEQGVDSEIPCWGVAVDTEDAGILHLQVTKTGGHVWMMMPEYSPGESNHSIEACRRSAEEFLRTHEYGEVEAAYYQVNFGMVTFNFVPVQDGVRLYPDLVKVQVSMQSGLVIGAESNNYLRNHVQREFAKQILSEEEIRSLVRSMKVTSVRLALIPKNGQELYCYEVRGEHEGEEYLVYLDAQTGAAQDILQVVIDEDGEEVV